MCRKLLYFLIAFTILGCQTSRVKTNESKAPTVIGPSQPSQASTPTTVQVPDFVAQRAPKVGLILGPGGAKAMAHVGVLQELERHKVPVAAVVGLEWGSLIAGLYAMNGQSHEVDWKISQITKPNIGAKKLFSKKWLPMAGPDYDVYLQKIFQQSRVEQVKIPFSCPFLSSRKIALVKKGSLMNAIKACMPFPPLYDVKDSMAAPYALADATDFLRAQGAELIILVNVLPHLDKSDFADWAEGDWSWFAWQPVQETLAQIKYFGVHEVIRVDTTSFHMTEVDQRLRLIQVGKQSSSDAIERIVKKYDF